MKNKILFLGTGGGRFAMITQTRSTAGFIIYLEDLNIYVDPGPGALVKCRENNVNLSKVDVLFISHAHVDHINDFAPIAEAMTNGGLRKRGVLIAGESCFNKEDTIHISKYHADMFSNVFCAKPGDSVKIKNYKFIFTPTKHDIDGNVGFVLVGKKIKIGYTSDTIFISSLIDYFADVDVLILNLMRFDKGKKYLQMDVNDAKLLLKKINPKLTIATHFGMSMLRRDIGSVLDYLSKETNKKIIEAKDNMIVDLDNIFRKEKSLTNFFNKK